MSGILGRRREKPQLGAPYPAEPPKQAKRMGWYQQALRASIMARTCPALLTEPEVITVLGEASLASFSTIGAPLYRATEVRQKLTEQRRQKSAGEPNQNPSIPAGYLASNLPADAPGTEGGVVGRPPIPDASRRLVARQRASRNPVLRQVAEEAIRDAVTEPAEPALPPIPEWARAPRPTPPNRCASTKPCADCGGRTQFGEKVRCGLCDRHPRLRVVETEPRCRYCGAARCDCAEIKARIVAGGEPRDDQILLAVHRVLAQRDRQRVQDVEREESRKHRAQLRLRRDRDAA